VTSRRLVRFLLVGGGAAALELATFQLLVVLGIPPVGANVLSFLVGMTSSFLGYRLWTFSGNHRLPLGAQFGAYAVLAAVNVVLSSLVIQGLISVGLPPWGAKVTTMACVALWNFALLNRLIFGRVQHPGSSASPRQPDAAGSQGVVVIDAADDRVA
jgi:putative flippase GtrA